MDVSIEYLEFTSAA